MTPGATHVAANFDVRATCGHKPSSLDLSANPGLPVDTVLV
ncbi:hypothetical protein LY15_001747 [Prauserella flava]|uniref:Uncharacterized protein n=1 Tax=Prauserella sediminis TaxID=577680 RepID=A0A839XH53_9PSEU|nr:hypothetical protein [Prauserella sediminis]MCR3719773.1 hypothetical protein [Prauserella flava]MCR3736684.1 hypothetical protein [Prauserella salsuginis]